MLMSHVKEFCDEGGNPITSAKVGDVITLKTCSGWFYEVDKKTKELKQPLTPQKFRILEDGKLKTV